MVSDYDADEDGSGQDESIDQRLSPSAIWVETIASAACGSGKTTIAGGVGVRTPHTAAEEERREKAGRARRRRYDG